MTATAQFSKQTAKKYKANLAKSYQLMEMHFEAYNLRQTEARHKIKLPHIFLAKELIRLYAMAFRRWQVAMGFDVALKWEDMPLLAINNPFLGEITGRTGRTIRNYRKVLERAGFFALLHPEEEQYTHHHGKYCDFEVAISPKFLYIESNRASGRIQIQDVPTWCLRKNFPPTSTSTVLVPEQEQLGPVSGKPCSEAEKPASESPEPLNEPPPGQPGQINPDEQSRQRPPEEEPPADPAPIRAQLLHQQAKITWNYARGWLYTGEEIPAARRQAIIALIEQLYGEAPPELFPKITRMYVHRLKLAQLYWHRQYGPVPPPEQFFNPQNTRSGFVLTKHWPDDEAQYPPPKRSTYRMPGARRRGPGRRAIFRMDGSRRSGSTTLSDIIK